MSRNKDFTCDQCGAQMADVKADSFLTKSPSVVYPEDVLAYLPVIEAENAKLRELVEHLQPIDCEGNVLDIADTVGMLRSEYDGDHEWDDVVVELALTKWGGDRWIVRGSKGEAWACDCLKTGYDEDAYEGSDDAEPIVNPSLIEVENAKLRELCADMLWTIKHAHGWYKNDTHEMLMTDVRGRDGEPTNVSHSLTTDEEMYEKRMRELGIEVEE